MPTQSPNFNLYLYNSTTDQSETFLNWRLAIDGPSSDSNMMKIDTALNSHATDITSLKTTRGAAVVNAAYVSPNYYEASGITTITSYVTGMMIALKLDTTSDGTVTLNINSLGIKSLMKINSSGTAINLLGADLIAGKYYIFTYDGNKFVWTDINAVDKVSIVIDSNGDIAHGDTSTQATSTNTGATVIQSVGLDTYGHVTSLATTTLAPNPNLLTNGNFVIAQRQTATTYTTITSGNYSADRWKLYAENADVQYKSNDYTGTGYFSKITNAGKVFSAQILEGVDSSQLLGKTVTFTVGIKGNASRTMRIGIIELNSSGTLDTVPAIVSSWGANGTNPTLGTNLAYIQSGSFTASTTEFTQYSVTAAIPTNSKNVIAAIWSDAQMAASDWFAVQGAKLEFGSQFTGWNFLDYAATLTKCLRYYEKSYPLSNAPGSNLYSTVGGIVIASGNQNVILFYSDSDTANSNRKYAQMRYSTRKRAAPTIRYWDMAGNLSKVSTTDKSNQIVANNVSETYQGIETSDLILYVQTATNCVGFAAHWDADAEI